MDPRYMEAIHAAILWASEDLYNRSVKVNFSSNITIPIDENARISIWCYDYKRQNGIFLKISWLELNNPIESIERELNKSTEERELEQYKKLKEKYESRGFNL